MQQNLFFYKNMYSNRKFFSYEEFIGRRIKDVVTLTSLPPASSLIFNVVLVSAVVQSESVIHISTLLDSFPV